MRKLIRGSTTHIYQFMERIITFSCFLYSYISPLPKFLIKLIRLNYTKKFCYTIWMLQTAVLVCIISTSAANANSWCTVKFILLLQQIFRNFNIPHMLLREEKARHRTNVVISELPKTNDRVVHRYQLFILK